jgi:hypothetical protein
MDAKSNTLIKFQHLLGTKSGGISSFNLRERNIQDDPNHKFQLGTKTIQCLVPEKDGQTPRNSRGPPWDAAMTIQETPHALIFWAQDIIFCM